MYTGSCHKALQSTAIDDGIYRGLRPELDAVRIVPIVFREHDTHRRSVYRCLSFPSRIAEDIAAVMAPSPWLGFGRRRTQNPIIAPRKQRMVILAKGFKKTELR
jgi:hypothetical protein